MKITEAQLKRIIAEEVQTAIDEGIFDYFKKGADVAKKAIGGVADVADVVLSSVKTADQAIVNAIYAARTNADKRLIQKASDLVGKLSGIMEEISIIGLPETEAANLSFFEILARSIGSSVEDLPRFKRQVEKETLVGFAERPDDASKSAIEMSRRQGAVPQMTGGGTYATGTRLEEQADAITEAILKRIIQKR